MPYLTIERKKQLDMGALPECTSDLDYVFARTIDNFFLSHGLRFETYAQVIAALESMKLEVARRFAWYEEEKKRVNGDVLRNMERL